MEREQAAGDNDDENDDNGDDERAANTSFQISTNLVLAVGRVKFILSPPVHTGGREFSPAERVLTFESLTGCLPDRFHVLCGYLFLSLLLIVY